MGLESVPGSAIHYHLIPFDAFGRERPEGDRLASRDALDELAREPVTDVFLMSHGWQGDVPAARDQYGRWIAAMAACGDDVARAGRVRADFRPLLVGVHWPSLPWGDERLQAAAPGFSRQSSEGVDAYANRLGGSAAVRAALETIFAAADSAGAAESQLPPDVRAAYETLDREAGLGSEGLGAGPEADREPFDPDRVFVGAKANRSTFGLAVPGRDDLLAPLRALSFWKMKERASLFGEGGANALLAALQQAAEGRNARFHLMGHSFGCVVVSAALFGPGGGGGRTRPVDSLALIQGAMSLWSYCDDIPCAPGRPGYFRRVLGDRRVRGPVVTTQSEFDTAVGRWYRLAAGVVHQMAYAMGSFPEYGGLGSFGVQGPGPSVTDRDMLPPGGSYAFEPGRVYNLAAGQYICDGGGFSGAHSDIAKPAVAHAVWEAALAVR